MSDFFIRKLKDPSLRLKFGSFEKIFLSKWIILLSSHVDKFF